MALYGQWPWPRALGAGLLAVALGVGGCSSDTIHEYHANSDRVTSGAGNAMAANRAVHTIDPWPYHSQNTQIDIDGKRAQVGTRRYENNTSIKPKGVSSSSTNGNSNGDQK
jgi:hypothetical protein